jgi:precorrin-6B methylase 2
MNSLDRYILANYRHKHGDRFEGNIFNFPEQQEYLSKAVNDDVKTILEIGFNAGHSSVLMLDACSAVKVTSFDIGSSVVWVGKKYIDTVYPGKHQLIVGNSNKMIPLFQCEKKYDLLFIDGSPEYSFVLNDLINCKRLSDKYTKIVLNGTSESINKAWNKMISTGQIVEEKRYSYGDRGWVTGKYIF